MCNISLISGILLNVIIFDFEAKALIKEDKMIFKKLIDSII
jgi:hypothetical protein